MSCSLIDVKGYALGELDERGSREAAAHVHACNDCRDELERLKLTQTALLGMREEEPLRRLAFVSDKVFEPRWWQRMWRSAPAMGLASAALLSCAILVHAYTRPAVVVQKTAVVDTASIERQVEARFDARLNAVVAQAVAQVRREGDQKTVDTVAAAEQRFELQRRADLATFADNLEMIRKQNSRLFVAANNIEERP